MEKIVVLDFGSQYSHLICRRIREFSVYAELVPYDISPEELEKMNIKSIDDLSELKLKEVSSIQPKMTSYSQEPSSSVA